MKKQTFTATLLAALLITALAGAALNSTYANFGPGPTYYGFVEPNADTKPPEVSILSPINNTVVCDVPVYNGSGYTKIVELDLGVHPPTGPTVLTGEYTHPMIVEIYYTSSWNQTKTVVYNNREYIEYWLKETYLTNVIADFAGKANVKGIPHGWQNITVYAEYIGDYYPYPKPNVHGYARFYINGSSVVSFFMDTAPPSILMLSPLNQQYTTQDVPLNFLVDKSTSLLTCSLDGAENVTMHGNTTLTGLSLGEHNVTVYACDMRGRMGASGTMAFSVSEPSQPFPSTLVATVSALISAVGVAACLLLYSKKRRRNGTTSSNRKH